MSRYVDVDLIKDALRTDSDEFADGFTWKEIWEEEEKCIDSVPTADVVEVVRCKDCKWWDKKDDATYGYCTACRHGYVSDHWEIGIYRTYKGDWYCADGEKVTE